MLIAAVNLEPHAFGFLNKLELVMNLGTVYLVIFAQLGWDTALTWVAILICLITFVLTIGRMMIPDATPEALEKAMVFVF